MKITIFRNCCHRFHRQFVRDLSGTVSPLLLYDRHLDSVLLRWRQGNGGVGQLHNWHPHNTTCLITIQCKQHTPGYVYKCVCVGNKEWRRNVESLIFSCHSTALITSWSWWDRDVQILHAHSQTHSLHNQSHMVSWILTMLRFNETWCKQGIIAE